MAMNFAQAKATHACLRKYKDPVLSLFSHVHTLYPGEAYPDDLAFVVA